MARPSLQPGLLPRSATTTRQWPSCSLRSVPHESTFSRRFALQTRHPAHADPAVPVLSGSATETSLKAVRWQQNIYALMANTMFTRLWTTSWRKWKERQISKLHVRQTLFVIRMLEAPFDFIGTSEIKVRP